MLHDILTVLLVNTLSTITGSQVVGLPKEVELILEANTLLTPFLMKCHGHAVHPPPPPRWCYLARLTLASLYFQEQDPEPQKASFSPHALSRLQILSRGGRSLLLSSHHPIKVYKDVSSSTASY